MWFVLLSFVVELGYEDTGLVSAVCSFSVEAYNMRVRALDTPFRVRGIVMGSVKVSARNGSRLSESSREERVSRRLSVFRGAVPCSLTDASRCLLHPSLFALKMEAASLKRRSVFTKLTAQHRR